MCALPHIPEACDPIVILCGDVPLVRASTLQDLMAPTIAATSGTSPCWSWTSSTPSVTAGCCWTRTARLCGIVEEADADEAQRSIRTINSGIYCVSRRFLTEALPRLDRRNAQGEFYLTDIIRVGYDDGKWQSVSAGGRIPTKSWGSTRRRTSAG